MDMALGVRALHVVSATFVVGIPVALAFVVRAHPERAVVERLVTPAEQWLWASLAVLVATGVGNLAVFDGEFPGGAWPTVLFTKLGFVAALLVSSAVRTFVIANLARAPEEKVHQLAVWYGVTAVLGVVVVMLAEVLAHG